MFDNTRKKVHNFFFNGKFAFFSEICVQHLRCYRNDLITSTVEIKTPYGPLEVVAWGLLYSIIREKLVNNLFSPEWLPFFLEICVFNNLLGPKELIVFISTVIVRIRCESSYFLTSDLSHSIIREKIGQNLFFTVKCLFFQKIVFSTIA